MPPRTIAYFRPGRIVAARDPMLARIGLAADFEWVVTARPGKDFDCGFEPELTPAQILRYGAFEGKYCSDIASRREFPREWFAAADRKGKLLAVADPGINLFGVKSRQPWSVWRSKGWLPVSADDVDVRGWFQWYMRYWLGRRVPEIDAVQIRRWKSFARHRGQILASYRRLGRNKPTTRDQKRTHRAKQRQALLQWAYDPWI